MKRLRRLFTEHPATQGETYFEHAKFALAVSKHLFVSSVCLVVHAALPFICPPEPYDLKSTKKYIDKKCECRE